MVPGIDQQLVLHVKTSSLTVDRVAKTFAGRAHNTTDSLGDATSEVTNRGSDAFGNALSAVVVGLSDRHVGFRSVAWSIVSLTIHDTGCCGESLRELKV